jgi:hypothetical protein
VRTTTPLSVFIGPKNNACAAVPPAVGIAAASSKLEFAGARKRWSSLTTAYCLRVPGTSAHPRVQGEDNSVPDFPYAALADFLDDPGTITAGTESWNGSCWVDRVAGDDHQVPRVEGNGSDADKCSAWLNRRFCNIPQLKVG